MTDQNTEATSVANQHGKAVDFDAAVNIMDDCLREELHLKLAPCSNQQFFDEYAHHHLQRFGVECPPDSRDMAW